MNWKNIFLKIQAAGLSQNKIAARLGRSQAWVSAASQGKYNDLSWADGNAVLALVKSVCDDEALKDNSTPGTSLAPTDRKSPEPIHECASGDPRYHPDRRTPDNRKCVDRREGEIENTESPVFPTTQNQEAA